MIQRPPPTEVVSDVPGKSSIVDYRETLQRIFGGWLAAGRVVDDGGVRAVDWVIPEGFERAPESSSAVATARTELLRLADEADATANEVAALLRKPTGSEQVRVPRQLAARMGGSGSGDFVMWAESELRPRKEMLTRAAAAVRRAVSRGDFVESAEGRVLLYGWAFLPPNFKGDFQAPAAGSVTLAIVDDPLHSDRAVVAFAWSSRGPVLDVELFRVDGAEAAVAGTRTSVSTDPAQDYWRFPPDEVPPGSRYIARVTGRWGRSDSNIVEIPAAPVIPPPPIAPEPPLAPIIPVAPPPEPVRLPDPPPVPPPPQQKRGCGCWAWLLWLLYAILGFLAFLLLLWLIGWLLPAVMSLFWSIFGWLFGWLFGWSIPTLPTIVDDTHRTKYRDVVWGPSLDGDRIYVDESGTTWIYERDSDAWWVVTPDGSTRTVSAWEVPDVMGVPAEPVKPPTVVSPPVPQPTPPVPVSPLPDVRRVPEGAPAPSPIPEAPADTGKRRIPEMKPIVSFDSAASIRSRSSGEFS